MSTKFKGLATTLSSHLLITNWLHEYPSRNLKSFVLMTGGFSTIKNYVDLVVDFSDHFLSNSSIILEFISVASASQQMLECLRAVFGVVPTHR